MKIDVHAHLDMVKDVSSVVERARKKGIVTIITNGGDVKSNRNALQLQQQYDIVLNVVMHLVVISDRKKLVQQHHHSYVQRIV